MTCYSSPRELYTRQIVSEWSCPFSQALQLREFATEMNPRHEPAGSALPHKGCQCDEAVNSTRPQREAVTGGGSGGHGLSPVGPAWDLVAWGPGGDLGPRNLETSFCLWQSPLKSWADADMAPKEPGHQGSSFLWGLQSQSHPCASGRRLLHVPFGKGSSWESPTECSPALVN